ncbi:hypothetical protein [Paenibacillus ferrarius]|uniref:hypothetical protein n=1 Tax=Paenibacillus ferrarius TaxID=1469647 RepID=UPI003D2B2258
MESYLKDIFNNYHLPIVYISIIFVVYRFFSRFKPITFVTANEVEQSLYSKESRIAYKVARFVFYDLVFGGGIFALATVLPKFDMSNKITSLFMVVVSLIVFGSYFYFYILNDSDKKLGRLAIVFSLLYMVLVVLIFSLMCSSVLSIEPETVNNTRSIAYIVVAILALVLAGFLQLLCKPVLHLLEFINKKYIYYEESGKRWYVHYPVNQKEIMIGDSHLPELCNGAKIISREKLVEKIFKIVDAKSLREKQKTEDLSKSVMYYTITTSSSEAIKVEVNYPNNGKLLIHSDVRNLKQAREAIALYTWEKLKDVPVHQLENIEIIECCRKIGKQQREEWRTWKIFSHLPKQDFMNSGYPTSVANN